ncbi:MAG: reverse transcriptase domain-containing protein [Burkholderiaceae bacterium]
MRSRTPTGPLADRQILPIRARPYPEEPPQAQVRYCVRGEISPLLASIYLHYVFDLWLQRWRRRDAKGDVIVVRYADDSVVGFEHVADASRFLEALQLRFAQFGLSLNEQKTRVLQFGRYAATQCKRAADVRLAWVHAHVRDQEVEWPLYRQATDIEQANAHHPQGDPAGAIPPTARTDRSGWHMAAPCAARLLQLPRRPWQQLATEQIPLRSLSGLVACLATAWSVWSDDLGALPPQSRALRALSPRPTPLPSPAILRVMTQGRSRMR